MLALLVVACGQEPAPESTPDTRPSASTPVPATPRPADTPEPQKEFRVAFINLHSPLTLDQNNAVAGDTFDDRLDLVIKDLKEFGPDLVGFNEASMTKSHGSVIGKLAKELKMEPQYARANPWFPGQSKEQSDDLAKQLGFEEGELILVRSDRYPVLGAERLELNPRTSESGEGRAALHVMVKGPSSVGKIDVYITHLTGGGDRVRRAQAADFAAQIAKTRKGNGPLIVMQGSDDPAGATTLDLYSDLGLREVGGDAAPPTCCRESVIGEQPPLKMRTDFLMTKGWIATNASVFSGMPRPRADGTLLYASDHDGIFAIFPIEYPVIMP